MKAVWWGASLLIMGVLWALDSSSAPFGLSFPRPVEWLGHTLAALVLGYALGRATGRRGTALVLAVWFGAADEVHQAFVAGREAGVQAWLFGLVGAWIGTHAAVRRAGPTPPEPGLPTPAVTGFPGADPSH